MKKQGLINKFVFPFLMLSLCVGLIAGCGNEETDSDDMDSDDMSMSTEQQSTNQDQMSTDMDEEQTFEATLEGSNEVPAVTTDASGSVTATLSGESLQVEGEFSGLSSEYAASHIHQAPEGENGSPIQPLDPTINDDNTSGSFDASYTLNESQIKALKAGNLYINIHSADHKSGELRGQLTEGM